MLKNLQWRRIFTMAGIVGVLAGVIPMFFGAELLYTTMPIAMMIAIYLLVPRIQGDRFPSGFFASLFTALIALGVYFLYQYARFDAATVNANLKTAVSSMPMLIIMISLFGSWFFAKTHEWTEKKRKELEAKRAGQTTAKKDKPYNPRATKKKFKKKKK